MDPCRVADPGGVDPDPDPPLKKKPDTGQTVKKKPDSALKKPRIFSFDIKSI